MITSDSDLGSTPLVPTHLEWDPEREIVTTIDTAQQKLMNYDLVAGQWTTVAR